MSTKNFRTGYTDYETYEEAEKAAKIEAVRNTGDPKKIYKVVATVENIIPESIVVTQVS